MERNKEVQNVHITFRHDLNWTKYAYSPSDHNAAVCIYSTLKVVLVTGRHLGNTQNYQREDFYITVSNNVKFL